MSSPARTRPSIGRFRRSSFTLPFLAVLVCSSLVAGPLLAEPGPPYRGRPLNEVLEELKEAGLVLIFSTAVVKPGLKVTVEPSATEPRALLEEILVPLGLEARDGPAGSVLILAAGPVLGSLRGRIRAAARGVPVGEAVVRLPAAAATDITGADGSFRLGGIPAGTYDLVVEARGFQPVTLLGVTVPRQDDMGIVIWLQEQPGFVTEQVVTPSQLSVVEQEVAALRSIGSEESVMVPSFGGDVSRVVEYLPGVTANDNSAALHIRGSPSEDVAFVLDGLELYDPFHLQSFQSPFSLIDSRIVDRVEFSGGGFTADFGDRHGGRLDIQTLLPDAPSSGELELGTLNSRFVSRGPFPEGGGSWLVAARGWYPDRFQDNIELGGGDRVSPRFGDLYTKLAFNASHRAVISVHALGVYDYLEFIERNPEPGEVGEEANATTRNAYIWVNFLTARTSDITSETLFSYGSIDRRRGGLSRPEDDVFFVDDSRAVAFLALRHDTAWRLGDRHMIKAGFEARELRARYAYRSEMDGDPNSVMRLRLNPDGRSAGVYAAYRVRVVPAFTTEVGLRWDRQDYTNDNQLSPRFNAVWKPREGTELRLGLGRYHQSQRIHELEIENGESRFRKAEESWQTEMSFRQALPWGLHLRLDAYDRLLTKLNPRYTNLWKHLELFPETGSDRVRIDADRARLKGIELLVRGDPERHFIWWASYAFSTAEDEVDGEKIPRRWDQTHAGKFLAGYRWGERWMISLAGTVHTGWPTTPLTATAVPDPNGGGLQIIETIEERNSDRFDTYIRLDAKGRYTIPLPDGRLSLTAEIININDRENPCCVDEFEFNPRSDGSVDVDRTFDVWRTLTPTFSVLWEY